MQRFDAIIVGGGIAGSSSAAALAAEGLDVLVCEAGLPDERRLAGELMHPSAAADLERLGLLDPLIAAGAAPVYGFAVFRGPTDPGTVLSYSEVRGSRPTSIAMEHSLLTHALLDRLRARPRVTIWDDARVLHVEQSPSRGIATVRRGTEELRVEAPLIVLANGRSSRIRDAAGIEARRGETLRMIGWRVRGGRLPYPGFGHVFAGGKTAALAYQISRDDVRVMIELEGDEVPDVPTLLALFPAPFREDVARAIADAPRRTSTVMALETDRVTEGRLAVVGDAGGCVHPLTATGIAFCTGDAMRLARELSGRFAEGRGVPSALVRYEARRRAPMRARVALGPALTEALTATSPEMRLLRHGLFRYWARSARGRRASMGLLSTHESRRSVLVREYVSVCGHALTGLATGVLPPSEIGPALRGLARRGARQLRALLA